MRTFTAIVFAVFAAYAVSHAAEELKIILPQNRTAFQTNEWIDISVARKSAQPLVAGTLTLTINGIEDKSKISASFELPALPNTSGTEHYHLNGWLIRPGSYSIEAAANEKVLERRHEILQTARSLATAPLAERIDLAEKLSDAFKRERQPVIDQLEAWAAWWRDVLLVQTGAADRIANLDLERELREDAGAHTTAEIAAFLQSIIETRTYLIENVQSRIALDALMLAAPAAR